MPVDEYGERADMLIDMNSPVSRNNPSQFYETGINRISEFVRRAIKETLDTKGVDPAFETLMEWYGDVNPNYETLVREICPNTEEKKGVVKDAIEVGPRLWIPPFLNTLTPTGEDPWHALRNVKKWAEKWGAKPSRVKYKIRQADGSGKEFVSDQEFFIGSKYIIHLHKIPEITAPGFAAVNHIGIPTKSNYENKYFPVSTNPYRFGEDEFRLLAMDGNIREVTRFLNMMANSPKGVNVAVRTLLQADNPTRIKRMPITNGELTKSSAPLRLFHNTTAALGVDTKDTITSSFEVPEELTEAIWSTAGEEGDKVADLSDDNDEEVVARRRSARKARTKKMMDDFMSIETGDDEEESPSDEIVEASDDD